MASWRGVNLGWAGRAVARAARPAKRPAVLMMEGILSDYRFDSGLVEEGIVVIERKARLAWLIVKDPPG